MVTFNTQEEFDSAVMAAVERYLQVLVVVDYSKDTEYNHATTDVDVRLRNDLSQTTFAQDSDYAYHM